MCTHLETDLQEPIEEPFPEEERLSFGVDAASSNSESGVRTLELLHRILEVAKETEWVEFKKNNADPERIGKYVSALSNSAALAGQPRGYLVWGVEDGDHSISGTSFSPETTKKGNEDLEPWLERLLDPAPFISFRSCQLPQGKVVILEIEAADQHAVRFSGTAYIRIGSYLKPIKDHPAHERRLWSVLNSKAFETSLALTDLRRDEVLELLDYSVYFELIRQQIPDNPDLIIENLLQRGFLTKSTANNLSITAMGALLFAKELKDFSIVERKAVRVVQYVGTNRLETIRSTTGRRGYANGFRGLMSYLRVLLPRTEVIGPEGVREDTPAFPDLAIRELVANMLIHQDLSQRGTGPMLEVFTDRLEFTNPGQPLIAPERFIDSPPQSRNEKLAGVMRTMGLCEELGSGWDKIAFEIEFHQLPAPLVEVTDSHTRVIVFGPRPLVRMEREDRLRAVYQHACLMYVSGHKTNNSSIRRRFGIADRNPAQASRLIKDAIDSGFIAPYDPSAGPRALRYVPFWANPDRNEI